MASIEEVLGRDIAHRGDLVARPDGDLDTISGLENIKLALFHRLVTQPGSLIHRPNYGVGIQEFQNSPASLSTQRTLALKIKDQFETDPRVLEVLGISYAVDDNNPSETRIIVRVKIQGYDEVTASFIPFGGEGVA